MLQHCLFLFLVVAVAGRSYEHPYRSSHFRVGIEYEHSLPMKGGADRFRHMNNYDPFYVTISVTAKNGFVIAYLDVSATVDTSGEVDFHMVRGDTGSKTVTFQLISNQSDFLSYTYLAYGIRDEEYKKISNIISLPIGNDGPRHQSKGITITTFIFVYFIRFLNLFYSS